MAEIKYNLGTLAVVPTGAVIPFAGVTAPVGFLFCDGSEVSRTDYPYLFEVIGTTYGEGDGNTTFNLPNLQDKFVQGSGTNEVGAEMSAGLPNITGSFSTYDNASSTSSGSFTKSIINKNTSSIMSPTTDFPRTQYTLNASRSNSVYGKSNTVQPPAVVMNYIIKY